MRKDDLNDLRDHWTLNFNMH